ncbi:hypothetical protein ABZ136_33095, partial [Streptomyces microflavus]
MTPPQLVVHRDKELMAQAAAARLITRIVDAQAARGHASVVGRHRPPGAGGPGRTGGGGRRLARRVG